MTTAQTTMSEPNEPFRQRVLEVVESLVRKDQFRAWFNDLSVLHVDDEEVEFGVPTGFSRDWLLRNYSEVLDTAVKSAGRPGLKVRVSMHKTERAEDPDLPHLRAPLERELAPPPSEVPAVVDEDSSIDAVAEAAGLNESYTFESFVVGKCNRLSHAAALAIGENPGGAYNPLFVHGNTGLGKTHLLQATCHRILRKRKGARVSFLSCEEFTNRYIRAIQGGTLDQFREFHRSVDVLVIDDIQFLANKERTQEEFFHTFNELYNNKNQIVISSDRSPQQIPMIEERLVSRFKWGLVAEMEAPSFDTRVAIVKRKSSCLGVDMPDDVAQHIAERIDRNIRELEGAVIKVIGVMRLIGQELSTELAADALRGVVNPRQTPVTVNDVLDLITDEYSVSSRDIMGKGRTQTISLPRQIAMYLTRELTDLSLEEIGRNFGGRDHTTVLYAVSKIKQRNEGDRRFRETIESLIARLQDSNR